MSQHNHLSLNRKMGSNIRNMLYWKRPKKKKLLVVTWWIQIRFSCDQIRSLVKLQYTCRFWNYTNLPCSPGCMQSMTSFSARTALTGNTPPPNALPKILTRKWSELSFASTEKYETVIAIQGECALLTTTSGRTFSQSQARILPERPSPLWISSAIIRMLYFEQRSLTDWR